MIISYHVKAQRLSLCFGTQKKEVTQPALYYFVSDAKLFLTLNPTESSCWKNIITLYLKLQKPI